MEKRVIHENGYSGILYGESSLSIYDLDGKDVFHAESRDIDTDQELHYILGLMPKLMAIVFEDDEDDI